MNSPLDRLLPELDRIEPRARAAVAALPDTKFHQAPVEGGWSVAEIFEHLCIATDSYVGGPIPAAIEKARADAKGPGRPWRPSFMGGMLTRALEETSVRKLPTPKVLRVGAVRANVVEHFLAGIRRLREQLVAADGLDLGTGLASPVSALIRVNLGDAFAINVAHAHRHLGQVERTRRALGV